ncbi:hypothetical protein KUTeg_024462 [Tegillarca granosa]|uniref:Uncharacterized protein n=1 Tax=Tegillarca granosa TaxID=220873 RepID=A0ABQ9E0G8_TEGGR|nr:hypothetical protein KUTeg_024462 [Tegillarca granosa]
MVTWTYKIVIHLSIIITLEYFKYLVKIILIYYIKINIWNPSCKIINKFNIIQIICFTLLSITKVSKQ